MHREIEEKEKGEHGGKTAVSQQGEHPVAFCQFLHRRPNEPLPGSEEDECSTQE